MCRGHLKARVETRRMCRGHLKAQMESSAMLPRSAHSPASSTAEAFARKVTATRTVWTVSGEAGLARVPSTNRPGRDVTLCWSTAEAAERLGRRVARHSRVNPILLGNFATIVLPKLRALNRLVAPDWTADPYHPQIEAGQLEQVLKIEAAAQCIGALLAGRTVYTLENDIGPAYAASGLGAGKLALPIWTRADDAAQHSKGFWAEMEVAEITLSSFVRTTLPQVAGIGRRWCEGACRSTGMDACARRCAAARSRS